MTFPTQQGWTSRAQSLEPRAVIARSEAAFSLAKRLLDRSDEELQLLRGVVSLEAKLPVLAIVGAFENLPWTPESLYLGHDESCSNLLWPIHRQPPYASALIEMALLRHFPALPSPLAVLPDWNLVLSLGEALPVRRDFIERVCEGEPS